MKYIYIRADGGISIGMGHIMRTLTLANKFRKFGYCVVYLCENKAEFESGINQIKDNGFEVILLPNDKVDSIINENLQKDCLMIDSYNVNEEYFDKAKQYFKVVGYFDDMNLYYFNVDFIINQNLGSELLKYNANENTTMFLGNKYTMIRDEFFKAKRKNINKKVENILITLGGSDANNLTKDIIEYVRALPYKFHIVVGSSFVFEKDLEQFECENILLHKNANMKELMGMSDICISACGSTLYELSYMGIPTVGIIIAKNQELVAYNMEKENVIINAGWYNKLNKEELTCLIEKLANDYELRKNMSLKCINLIDGKGAERIVKELKL